MYKNCFKYWIKNTLDGKFMDCLYYQVGIIEVSTNHIHEGDWSSLEEYLMVTPSGASPTRHEATISSLRHVSKSSGRSLEPDDPHSMFPGDNVLPVVDKEENVRVRVKLCLENNIQACGDYVEAESEYRMYCVDKVPSNTE